MRIVIWTDAFAPQVGGLEVFCFRLMVALKALGHECLIITNRVGTKNLGLDHWHGVPVHGFSFDESQRSGNVAAVRRDTMDAAKIIEDFNPDLIHFNVISRTLINVLILQRMKRRPAVWTLHDGHGFEQMAKTLLSLLTNVDKIVAVSESVRMDALKSFPQTTEKLLTILNALPAPKCPATPLPGNQKILAFGRLVKSKGFDVSIRAFARIAEQFPEASLSIAGDGAEKAPLEQLARETGFGERIHFLGWISPDEIDSSLNDYQLIVMPSRWKEPFGLVALQTAWMGRPLVATNTGGIPEIVVDGVTGKLFENENDLDMANAMASILRDPGLAAEMGRQAYAHVRQHFDFAKMVSSYESLFWEVAAKGSLKREVNLDKPSFPSGSSAEKQP